jgi:hypothetical protein
MAGSRRRAWVALVAVGLVLAGQAGLGSAAQAAPARARSAASVAAVTVDFGNGTIDHATVSFTSSTISGLDALRGAGFTVAVYGYSGVGGAVCSIDGVGRPADSSCLSGGVDYWEYYRNGVYSSVGASNTKVHDHDQEQWKWGSGGSAPPTTAWPPPVTQPPRTTVPTTRPRVTVPPTTQAGGHTVSPPPTLATPTVPGQTTVPGATTVAGTNRATQAAGPPGSTVAGASTTTAPKGAPATSTAPSTSSRPVAKGGGRGVEAAVPVVDRRTTGTGSHPSSGGGGPLWSILGFGAVLALFAGLIVRARRHRTKATPPAA